MMQLAWRNIWRNRRRAIITMASVFFAVFFSVLMKSFNTGVWDKMVDNTLRTQTGHIQIHGTGYWDDKVIDNFMLMDAATIAQIENISGIENVSPRVETFAMAASAIHSKGIAIIGVSPEKEARKSNLPSHLVGGNYLSETDDGILIGEGLAKYLEVTVGDTLALIGQGYHGSSAAGLFPIRGILKLMTAEMDNSMAYVTLPAAQYFIDMPDGYSGILISVKEGKRLNEIMEVISCQLSVVSGEKEVVGGENTENWKLKTENYEVLSWHFTMERLLQQAQSDMAFGSILMLILYLIVGFGILGTIIMMTNERKREFSMMISLGMSRMRLTATTVFELLVMSLTGVILALGITLPIALWFNVHPIQMSGNMADMFIEYGMEPVMPMSVDLSIFTNQIIIILVIVALTVIYPVRKIFKLKLSK